MVLRKYRVSGRTDKVSLPSISVIPYLLGSANNIRLLDSAVGRTCGHSQCPTI
jgi:hypothetical protein